MRIPSLLALLALAAGCNKNTTAIPAADTPALHRLTEVQLDNSLRDLFLDSGLEGLDLPPDLSVHGFENNADVRSATPYLVETIQRDLVALTAEAMDDPGDWLHCDASGGADPLACGTSTLLQFAPRAFRRPLTEDEAAWITGLFAAWHGSLGFDAAMQLSLQTLLQSPDFLYLIEPAEPGPLDDWQIASRLSYFLWDTMPDAELFQAASEGQLSQPETLTVQAERVIRDERSQEAMVRFHAQWLDLDRIESAAPDMAAYFTDEDDEEELGGQLTEFRLMMDVEFSRFVVGTLGGAGTLDALLTSREAWVNDFTAFVYGVDVEGLEGEYFSQMVGIDEYEFDLYRVTLPAEQRAGILTRAAFLAGHAHALQPSPVLRGVFVKERLLCEAPAPPPDDVPPLEEDDDGDYTTNRDRYSQHTNDPACAGCHESIDGIGFTFEHYDVLGAWRDTDNGYPVDASGQLIYTDVDGPLTDAVELSAVLAGSRQVHDCASLQWFRYAMHRSETDGDAAAVAALQEQFFDSGGDVMPTLLAFVTSDAFTTRGGQ